MKVFPAVCLLLLSIAAVAQDEGYSSKKWGDKMTDEFTEKSWENPEGRADGNNENGYRDSRMTDDAVATPKGEDYGEIGAESRAEPKASESQAEVSKYNAEPSESDEEGRPSGDGVSPSPTDASPGI